jgi:hypothetical protein
MAFDQSTRVRLQRFVTEARALLTEEFTRQLQSIYGMNPVTGEVSDISTLSGLTPREQETAQLLRDTLDHYITRTEKTKDKKSKQFAIQRITREQSFTVLNRLVALRMSEARGLLIESINKGFESKGFQLFHRVSGASLGDTGTSYRHYVFSLYDEFSLDFFALFDRFAVEGRLFPSALVLQELLAKINDEDMLALWPEDETIGWIYQYFNSIEERKKMRAASATPRNSRELAIRNQFFTPRYVVEFLVDNTLGQIWSEMTSGDTCLFDKCKYLVNTNKKLSNTTKQRKIKDPRDIKMLDPACGSMHFGLYAFDLFEFIYDESWELELSKGISHFSREFGRKPLTETYKCKDDFLIDVPRLIIENNIYGVDIDPRAVQISGLSLWLRAQKSWHETNLKQEKRPFILRSNIVCAEPMPRNEELLKEFVSALKPSFLGEVIELIFAKMETAGEAGTLLQIEIIIRSAIKEAEETWKQQQSSKAKTNLTKKTKTKNATSFDVSGINNGQFWKEAEDKIMYALFEYSKRLQRDESERKRLFFKDAARGVAFLELLRQKFDVLLMNPPFGQGNKSLTKQLGKGFPGSGASELGASFFTRALQLTNPDSLFGSITSRTCFYLNSLSEWRVEQCLKNSNVLFFADLGEGILDEAMNETACYIVKNASESNEDAYFGMFHDIKDKEQSLLDLASKDIINSRIYLRKPSDFNKLNDAPFCYWVSKDFINTLPSLLPLGEEYASVQMGLAPRDEYRYSRAWWEIPIGSNDWKPYAKGGELTAYYSDIELVLKDIDDLSEIKANLDQKYPYLKGNLDWVLHPENSYFEPGLTFGQRTTFLRTSAIPAGCYFSVAGKGIFGTKVNSKVLMQAINTQACQFLVSLRKERFSIDPQYQEGDVSRVPFPLLSKSEQAKLSSKAEENYQAVREISSYDEIDHAFLAPCFSVKSYDDHVARSSAQIYKNEEQANLIILKKLNLNKKDIMFIKEQIEPKWVARSTMNWYQYDFKDIFSYLLGSYYGRWRDQEEPTKSSKDMNLFSKDALISYKLMDSGEDSSEVLFMTSSDDLSLFSSKLLEMVKNFKSNDIDNDLIDLLRDKENLFQFLTSPKLFFEFHMRRYSKNGRKAPIFLPIQSNAKNITIWLYYPKLNDQTIFTCINNFVDPSLSLTCDQITTLQSCSLRSKEEEKELNRLVDYKSELEVFREELARIAKIWKPDLNDGVQITMAPFWRLFRHKDWQKKLKQTWEKLESGDYDWAHLSYSIWPERVLQKCLTDRSLAIAHKVESDFWYQDKITKKWKLNDLSDSEIKTFIKGKVESLRN